MNLNRNLLIKKCLACLIYIISISTGSDGYAQTFFQSAGVSILRSKGVAPAGSPGFEHEMSLNGVTYFPRKNLSETGSTALSIGLPVTFGWSGNIGNNGSMFSIGVDAPLVADYNFGHGSVKENEQAVGGYLGAGFGLTYIHYSQQSTWFGDYSATGKSYGPLVRAGFRFRIPLGVGQLSFTLGGFYKIGLEEEKYKTGGGSLLMNF
jgi:hypothetical protein